MFLGQVSCILVPELVLILTHDATAEERETKTLDRKLMLFVLEIDFGFRLRRTSAGWNNKSSVPF